MKKFNMIELALSIAILAMAIVAVMSLYFVGLEQNKNSIGENYTAISADDLFSYMSRVSLYNWSAIINGIPEGKAGFSDSAYLTSVDNWGSAVISDIYTPTSDPGVYGIKITTDGIVDFAAEVRIWRNALSDWYIPGEDGYTVTGDTNINPSSSAKSTFEVSGVTVNGGTIDKTYLQHHEDTYEGPATSIRIKGQNTCILTVDNTYTLDIKDDQKSLPGDYDRFTFSASKPITIRLRNTGHGLGNWMLEFVNASGVEIEPDPGFPKKPKTSAIFVEVSWPINASYKLRNKKSFYFEIFDMENI